MGIGRRIREARENKGYTQNELASIVGVTGSAITNYEKETSHPKEPVLYKLIDVLGVDANYLFQDCVASPASSDTFSPREIALMYSYRDLDTHGREMVDVVVEKETARMKEEAEARAKAEHKAAEEKAKRLRIVSDVEDDEEEVEEREIPYYLEPASAGFGNYMTDNYYEMLSIPDTYENARVDFAIRVSGDSMEPDYEDGDIVLVESTPVVNDGEVGIFIYDGESYIKQLDVDRENNTVRLVSFNEDYEDKEIVFGDDSDVYLHTVGRVIGIFEE